MSDDLARDLNDLIPELDASTVLDGAAHKRRRTRRRTTALAGAVAVVVLTPAVLGLGAALRSTPGPPASSPAVSDGSPGVELHPGRKLMSPECQEAMDASVQPDRVPAEGLPDGATRVWLCGELDVMDGAKQWIGPRSPLVTHADDVVTAINALPDGTAETAGCHDRSDHRYRMVVEYADARHVIDVS